MRDEVTEQSHLQAIGLPPEGVQYVLDVAASDPARKVGVRRKRNVVFEVAMQRLRVVLQAESLSGEFLFLNGLDVREDVRAVFDQPLSRTLCITDKSGRVRKIECTSDYLVVYHTECCAYEIKPDDALRQLCAERPEDWRFDETGYHFLPAESDFRALGIRYEVIPTSRLSATLADNQRLLATIRQIPDTKDLRRQRSKILKVVRADVCIRTSEVLSRLEARDATPVLQLIAEGAIFADITDVLLSDPMEVWVSTTPERARVTQQTCRGFRAALRDSTSLTVDGLCPARYQADLAIRYAIVNGNLNDIDAADMPSDRTIRRLKQIYRESGNDPSSLVPSWSSCGNGNARKAHTHVSFAEGFIRHQRSDPDNQSVHQAHINYKRAFGEFVEETGLTAERPGSRRWFYGLHVTTPGLTEDATKKGGRRLANATSDPFDPNLKTFVATRPFAVAHIDHYKTDLHALVGWQGKKKITKRMWLTAMVDAFTSEVLAIWLSFADPSKKACSMVIRDCARRHHRVPEIIIVDGGSDFRSDHFAALLACLKVTRGERPAEDPRFGKEAERLFGVLKERFLRGLPGYGLQVEQARKIATALKAPNRAELSLVEFFELLTTFVFEGYNASPKPGTTVPRVQLRMSAEESLPHNGRRVEWDLKFLIASSIEPPKGEYTLWKGRGINVYEKWYVSPVLLSYVGYKKDLPIRLEPFDDSLIYVSVDSKWYIANLADRSYHDAMSERRIVAETQITHELRSVIHELENLANQEAAAIVEQKLAEIRNRSDSKPRAEKQPSKQKGGPEKKQPNRSLINYDSVESAPLD